MPCGSGGGWTRNRERTAQWRAGRAGGALPARAPAAAAAPQSRRPRVDARRRRTARRRAGRGVTGGAGAGAGAGSGRGGRGGWLLRARARTGPGPCRSARPRPCGPSFPALNPQGGWKAATLNQQATGRPDQPTRAGDFEQSCSSPANGTFDRILFAELLAMEIYAGDGAPARFAPHQMAGAVNSAAADSNEFGCIPRQEDAKTMGLVSVYSSARCTNTDGARHNTERCVRGSERLKLFAGHRRPILVEWIRVLWVTPDGRIPFAELFIH